MASRPPWSLAAVTLALALCSGCDDAEDDDVRALDLADLPERFACDDVTVVAAAIDGSEALLIGVEDGLAAAARKSGEVIEAEYTLPNERLIVRWVAGSNVYAGHCGRARGDAWKLDERSDAITGQLAIRITPHSDGRLMVSATLDELLLAPTHPGAGPVYELSTSTLDGLQLTQ